MVALLCMIHQVCEINGLNEVVVSEDFIYNSLSRTLYAAYIQVLLTYVSLLFSVMNVVTHLNKRIIVLNKSVEVLTSVKSFVMFDYCRMTIFLYFIQLLYAMMCLFVVFMTSLRMVSAHIVYCNVIWLC